MMLGTNDILGYSFRKLRDHPKFCCLCELMALHRLHEHDCVYRLFVPEKTCYMEGYCRHDSLSSTFKIRTTCYFRFIADCLGVSARLAFILDDSLCPSPRLALFIADSLEPSARLALFLADSLCPSPRLALFLVSRAFNACITSEGFRSDHRLGKIS